MIGETVSLVNALLKRNNINDMSPESHSLLEIIARPPLKILDPGMGILYA
jgi:hypothetical protein